MNSTLIKVAASSLALGATLVGCTPSTKAYRPTVASDKSSNRAGSANDRAIAAMQKGDTAGALVAMEQAVALSPQDVGFRRSLAELYLKSGRFVSAEATYADVLALNPGDAKAGFFLALSQLAQGRTGAALVQLDGMDSSVEPGDLGLAFALAGQSQRAIALLESAAREPGASGRVRQNLALAYALAGDWKRARLVAAQDASPTDLNKRLAQWAALASSTAPATRVAGLLGVSPAQDPGQPTALALAPKATAPASVLAEAAPQPAVSAGLVTAPVEVAQAAVPAVQYVEEPAAPAAASAYAAQPILAAAAPRASEQPSRSITPASVPAYVAKPAGAAARKSAASGRFVVQIGAYRSPAQVEKAWSQIYKRFPVSGQPQSTTVSINGKGTFHRLSIAGFGNREAAARTCQTIQAKGGACFVRATAGDAPVQWASRYVRRV